MATVTRVPFSASTDFRGIKVVATATAGTAIHTAAAGVLGADELYIWAYNSSASGVLLTLEWGGVTVPDDNLAFLVPGVTTLLVAGGLCLRNGLIVRAFAGTANVIALSGYCNRVVN